MDRALVVDALRGVAIVLMLLQHAPLYLLAGFEGSVFYGLGFLVSRLSAPLFFLLAGFSVVLSGSRRIAVQGKPAFMRHVVWRCLTLFAMGFLVNVFTSKELLFLNVLHVIALMVFFASLLYVSGSRRAYVITLALSLAYCLIGPAVVSDVAVDSPISFVVWLMASGEYPLGPWFVYALVGLGVGLFFSGFHVKWICLFYSGWLLVVLGMLFVPVGYRNSLLANTPPIFFISMGFIMVVYFLLEFMRGWIITAGVVEFLAVYGRHSLALYVGHQFLLGFVPTLLGFRNAFGVVTVLSVFTLFLLLFYAVARLTEKSG